MATGTSLAQISRIHQRFGIAGRQVGVRTVTGGAACGRLIPLREKRPVDARLILLADFGMAGSADPGDVLPEGRVFGFARFMDIVMAACAGGRFFVSRFAQTCMRTGFELLYGVFVAGGTGSLGHRRGVGISLDVIVTGLTVESGMGGFPQLLTVIMAFGAVGLCGDTGECSENSNQHRHSQGAAHFEVPP
jgi:hypothetical protein